MELNDAQKLAIDLMNEQGLTSWNFEFDNSLRRFGRCNRRRATISLSKNLVKLNDEARVRQTIVHEIAHALTKGGHNWMWREKAIELGHSGRATYSIADTIQPKPNYIGTCPACGDKTKAYRLRSNTTACAKCCDGVWKKEFVIKWEKIK